MKKSYYVCYYNNFGNTYRLAWADNPADISALIAVGYSRITRDEALRLAREEAIRQRDDPSAAYFADAYIYPYSPKDYNPDLLAPVGKTRILALKPRRSSRL